MMIWLRKATIKNYRRFVHETINFERGITIIAGSNNSGKSSIVGIISKVLGSEYTISKSDYNMETLRKWTSLLWDNLFSSNCASEKELCDNIEKYFGPDLGHLGEFEPIKLQVQIDYDPLTDDITYFSEYLMDFDETHNSLYFEYAYDANISQFLLTAQLEIKKLFDELNRIYATLGIISTEKTKTTINNDLINELEKEMIQTKNQFFELFTSLFFMNCKGVIYYCNSDYSNRNQLNSTVFKSLFDINMIIAGRVLEDNSENKKFLLSKELIETASNDDEWAELIKDLPQSIISTVEKTKIKNKIKDQSIRSLSSAIDGISSTNGNQPGNIVLDFNFSNEKVSDFLSDITEARYEFDGIQLNEASQGLGYSNLIFLHLQLQKYIKIIDRSQMNMIIIEEPENHMHPQMQKVFIRYLFKYFADHQIQGVITTHSSEAIQTSEMINIRVVRKNHEKQVSNIYDLNIFLSQFDAKSEKRKFYSLFFDLNFSNLVFADKAIFYEGDTERMYIKTVVSNMSRFSSLSQEFISYIQVGGTFAYWYFSLIEFLKMKSLFITDIDYEKSLVNIASIKASTTSNETIKMAFEFLSKKRIESINDFYEMTSCHNEIMYIASQGSRDGYTRTLEEAMLCKLYGEDVSTINNREVWKARKSTDHLQISIPQKEPCDIRQIMESLANNKTDFMYSIIFNHNEEKALPHYIEEGLLWLMK